MEAVQIVQHRRVERRSNGALFLVAADVDVVVVSTAVNQPMDQPRVGMEGEDDRLVPEGTFAGTIEKPTMKLVAQRENDTRWAGSD